LIARAGGAVAGIFGEGAMPTLLGRAAQLGVQGMTEGALYSGADVVHEAALGDHHLTAQHVISQLGLGMVLGGGLGGVLGVAERGLPKAAQMSANALGNLANKAKGAIEGSYPAALEAVTGADRSLTADILATRGTEQLGNKKFLGKWSGELADSLQTVHEANQGAFKSVKQLKGEAFENLLADAPRPKVEAKAQELINELGSTAQDFRAQGSLRSKTMAKQFEVFQEELVEKLKGGKPSHEIFETLDDYKKVLQGIGKTAAKSGNFVTAESGKEATRLGSMFREALEDESAWGKAGAAQAKVNGALTELRDIEKTFLSKISEKRSIRGRSVQEISAPKIEGLVKQLDSPKGLLAADRLDAWHQASVKVANAVQELADHAPQTSAYPKGMGAVMSASGDLLQQTRQQQSLASVIKGMQGGQEGALGTLGAAALVSHVPVVGPPAAAVMGLWKGISSVTNPARVAEVLGTLEKINQAVGARVAQGAKALFGMGTGLAERRVGLTAAQLARLEDLSSSPGKVQEVLEGQVKGIQTHAPNTASAMQVSTSSALGLLMSKMPKPQPAGPLDKVRPVSASDKAKLDTYASTLNDPVGTILGAMKNGSLRPEQVETLKTAYPALYQQIVNQVIEHSAGKDISYEMRQQMSLLMGQDMDGSLRGLRANQSIADIALQNAPPLGPKSTRGGKSGASKLHGASRMMSAGQASLNRESLPSMK